MTCLAKLVNLKNTALSSKAEQSIKPSYLLFTIITGTLQSMAQFKTFTVSKVLTFSTILKISITSISNPPLTVSLSLVLQQLEW